MRRHVLGSIGLTYGIAVIIYAAHDGLRGGTVAYEVGEASAFLFAAVVIYFSARTIIRAINERHHDASRR